MVKLSSLVGYAMVLSVNYKQFDTMEFIVIGQVIPEKGKTNIINCY